MGRLADFTGLGNLDASLTDPAQLEAAVHRRMFRFGAIALTVVTLVYVADHLLEHHPRALLGDLALLANVAACSAYARRTALHKRALSLMHSAMFVVVLYHAYLQGTVNTAAYWWLSVLPFVSVMSGSMRLGIVQLAGFIAVGIVAGKVSLGGAHLPIEPHAHNEVHIAFSSLLATGYSFLFVFLAYRWREQLQRAVSDARTAAIEAAASRARFLANMSHEIRTPLNGVIGAAELLRKGSTQATQRAQLLSLMSQSATSLLALVNDVLDWSKLDVGKVVLELRPLYLRALVFESNELFAVSAFDKGIELTSSCAPDVPRRVLGDATRIRQVVNNLVSNAVKFTATGGVHIAVSADGDAPSTSGSGDRVRTVRIEVADTGVGIAEDKLDALFSAFVQGDETVTREFGGTGLGLAISQELARLMGGRIDVRSAPGQGSAFTFVVPMQVVDEPAPEAPAEKRRDIVLASGSDGLTRHLTSLLQELHVDPVVLSSLPDESALAGCRLLLVDTPLLKGIAVRSWIDQHTLNGRRILVVTPLNRDAVVGSLPDAMLLYKPVRRSSLRALIDAATRPDAAPAGEPRPARDAQPRPLGLRVLVAEDNSVNQVIVQAMLSELGASARVVENGEQALVALADEAFDLVLMDVQMPVMDGLSATRMQRSREAANGGRRTPVVAMTANAEADEGKACRDAGMDDFLAKPFGIVQLRRLLAAYAKAAPGRSAVG